MDRAYLERIATVLRTRSDIVDRLDPGLSDSEVEAVQKRFGFTFPTDLRAVLQYALPIGNRWPDWRGGSDHDIQTRLDLPLQGVQFDVANGFWLDDWGPKLPEGSGRLDALRRIFNGAPRLIPVYLHRFLPAEPLQAGNPIFSVHQTDIICYGNDLANYFHEEFGVPLPEWAARQLRPIRFWSDALTWRDQEGNYRR